MKCLAVAATSFEEGVRTHRVDQAGGQRRRVQFPVVPEHHELWKRRTTSQWQFREPVKITRVDVRPRFVPLVLVAELQTQQLQNAHFPIRFDGVFSSKYSPSRSVSKSQLKP